jgi:hypothetical protein
VTDTITEVRGPIYTTPGDSLVVVVTAREQLVEPARPWSQGGTHVARSAVSIALLA